MIEQCADYPAETAANTAVTVVDRQESDNLHDRDNHRIQQNWPCFLLHVLPTFQSH
jgi:hypothetical protein